MKTILNKNGIFSTKNFRTLMSLALLVLLISCNNQSSNPQADHKQPSSKSNKLESKSEDVTFSSLKNRAPLTKEQLEGAIPLEINELKLNETKFIDQMQMIQATYDNNFRLTIQDFAGTNGSAINHFYQSFENKTGSSQIYKERDGFKTTSIYKYNDTEFSYVYLDRFFITLDAKKLNPDQLWDFFDPNLLSSLEILNQ
ncbi:MAG: hypothetical protein RQ756_04520 [Flavobacteriaceae bacterium]|nr:hypothetical protein [Flavobacteriaceae bacterium]